MSAIETKSQTRIPLLLKERGHSVRWFCDRLGIDRSYYYLMESGKRPVSADYVARASRLLLVPEALLLPTDVVNTTRDIDVPQIEVSNAAAA